MAAEKGVATQMGNLCHSCESIRRIVQNLRSGKLGPVKKVVSHMGKKWGATSLPPEAEKPAGLDWEAWPHWRLDSRHQRLERACPEQKLWLLRRFDGDRPRGCRGFGNWREADVRYEGEQIRQQRQHQCSPLVQAA